MSIKNRRLTSGLLSKSSNRVHFLINKHRTNKTIITGFNLVSTWYEIPSKFNKDTYFKWIRNIFRTNTPIIVFTDAKGKRDLNILYKNLTNGTSSASGLPVDNFLW